MKRLKEAHYYEYIVPHLFIYFFVLRMSKIFCSYRHKVHVISSAFVKCNDGFIWGKGELAKF